MLFGFVTGSCPGQITLASVNGTPFGSTVLLRGTVTGPFVVAGPTCNGTVLGLADPTIQQVVEADGSGASRSPFDVAAGACGLPLQIVDVATCSVTGVVRIPTP